MSERGKRLAYAGRTRNADARAAFQRRLETGANQAFGENMLIKALSKAFLLAALTLGVGGVPAWRGKDAASPAG